LIYLALTIKPSRAADKGRSACDDRVFKDNNSSIVDAHFEPKSERRFYDENMCDLFERVAFSGRQLLPLCREMICRQSWS